MVYDQRFIQFIIFDSTKIILFGRCWNLPNFFEKIVKKYQYSAEKRNIWSFKIYNITSIYRRIAKMIKFTFNEVALMQQLDFASKEQLIERLEMLQTEDEDLSQDINNLIFKLYDLSETEAKKLVEDKLNNRFKLFQIYVLDPTEEE